MKSTAGTNTLIDVGELGGQVSYKPKELGKTMIKHIEANFEPHKCVLVGNKKGNKVKLDMVNLAIAETLSETGNVHLLDNLALGDGETFYLVAHGVYRTRTIDGRSLKEIARLLVRAGFNGTQKVISFACDADKTDPSHKKSMNQELQEAIAEEMLNKGFKTAPKSMDISNYANGKTILVRALTENNSKPQADLWVVNPQCYFQTRMALMAQKFLMYIGNYFKLVDIRKAWASTGIPLKTTKEEKGILDKKDLAKLNNMQSFKLGLVDYFINDKYRELLLAPFGLPVLSHILIVLGVLTVLIASLNCLFTGASLLAIDNSSVASITFNTPYIVALATGIFLQLVGNWLDLLAIKSETCFISCLIAVLIILATIVFGYIQVFNISLFAVSIYTCLVWLKTMWF